MVVKRISIDVESVSGIELKAKKGENESRKIVVTFVAGNEQIILTKDMTVTIRGVKPDGTVIYNAMSVNESGDAEYTFLTDDCSCVGIVNYEVEIISGEKILYTSNFNLIVEDNKKVDGEVQSSSSFTALQAKIIEANSVIESVENKDLTLSENLTAAKNEIESVTDEAIEDATEAIEESYQNAKNNMMVALKSDNTVTVRLIKETVASELIDNAGDKITVNSVNRLEGGNEGADALVIYLYDKDKKQIDTRVISLSDEFPQTVDVLGASYIAVMKPGSGNVIMDVNLTVTQVEDLELGEATEKFINDMTDIMNETKQIAKSVKDDADNGAFKGEPGEQGEQGEPGKDYVLTDADKEEIAKKVYSDKATIHKLVGNNRPTSKASDFPNVKLGDFAINESYKTWQCLYKFEDTLMWGEVITTGGSYIYDNFYSKLQVNNLISAISSVNFEVVQELPTSNISTTTIYLVPNDSEDNSNLYEEYIYINDTWECIGTTTADLSNYYTKAEIDETIGGVSALVDEINGEVI